MHGAGRFAATTRAAQGKDAVRIPLGAGAVAFYTHAHPQSIYFAERGSNAQVEGAKRPYLTVGTYPFAQAYPAIRVLVKANPKLSLKLAHGGLAVIDVPYKRSILRRCRSSLRAPRRSVPLLALRPLPAAARDRFPHTARVRDLSPACRRASSSSDLGAWARERQRGSGALKRPGA